MPTAEDYFQFNPELNEVIDQMRSSGLRIKQYRSFDFPVVMTRREAFRMIERHAGLRPKEALLHLRTHGFISTYEDRVIYELCETVVEDGEGHLRPVMPPPASMRFPSLSGKSLIAHRR
jgi:hypothetical protein